MNSILKKKTLRKSLWKTSQLCLDFCGKTTWLHHFHYIYIYIFPLIRSHYYLFFFLFFDVLLVMLRDGAEAWWTFWQPLVWSEPGLVRLVSVLLGNYPSPCSELSRNRTLMLTSTADSFPQARSTNPFLTCHEIGQTNLESSLNKENESIETSRRLE